MTRRDARRAVLSLLLLLPLGLATSGCTDDADGTGSDAGGDTGGGADLGADSGSDTGAGGDTAGDAADVGLYGDNLAGLPGEAWSIIRPGGDTICSRGDEFFFAVRPGTVNRVVIEFMGGGACWDQFTCSVAGSIFNEDLDGIEDIVQDDLNGIYEHDNAENPVADWHHVFVPYCTGDIHWGDATTTYGTGSQAFDIHHRGAVNVRAVLDWVYEAYRAPEELLVTGCSAGAYGAIGWAPHIIQHYPEARVTQLGDSGVGVITDSFFRDSFPSWNPWDAMPAWIPELDPEEIDYFELTLSDLYARVANYYPEQVFSQYTTAYDDNQSFYFEAMGGGDQFDWSELMYAAIADAEEKADNFYSFVAPGEQHCILPFANFYSIEARDIRFVDWLGGLLDRTGLESHACGDDCEPPAR